MAKKRKDFRFDEKMDMTPLIDCVFLLIMFFILTTEITMTQAELELPFALEGEAEKAKGDDTTIVLDVPLKRNRGGNLTEDGIRKGIGQIEYLGNVYDEPELVKLFAKEVKYDAADPPYGRGRSPEIIAGGRRLSQIKVRVRADKRVNAEYLRTVFMACQQVDPAIYKLEVSSEQPGDN